MKQTHLFKRSAEQGLSRVAPLAERMRPESLKEFVGQAQLLGERKLLRRLIDGGHYQSLVLWGPPGCGKTTLANIMARQTNAHLISMSAVMAGTREIRSAVDQAKQVFAREGKRTWLFMDEIHRLNKAQQDTLLPHVEQGTFCLLGATTENPSFEVIRPLLSRAKVLVLEGLAESELKAIIHRALEDEAKGLGSYRAELTAEAEQCLVSASSGDARVALNGLEVAVMTTPPSADQIRRVSVDTILEVLQRKTVHYDKGGEEHFNLLSAFHKSLRGSDPDAALYWFFRMLQGGEDPLTPGRRLVAAASEDVGLADPFALVQANNAIQAYRFLGSPEGELALAQAIIYVSLAPKSNAVYVALREAREAAGRTGNAPVPLHLRNAPTALLKTLGYGRHYRYPHDDPRGWIPESYLPEELEESVFYRPKPLGWEGKWRDTVEKRRRKTAEARRNK